MWKDIIDKRLIIVNPVVKDKQDLFRAMVNHVYNCDYVINQKEFLSALIQREKVSNTELMPGVAFPHARSRAAEKLFLSIIVLKKGINYDNPEMGPVNIIFFFGCTEDQSREYLQMLAKSSRLLKDEEFREKLIDCETPDEVVKVLMSYAEEEEEGGAGGQSLLILTLNKTEKLDEVMAAMVETGITNASIVESVSMARKLAYEMPIFAGLSYMSQSKSKDSILILAYVDNREIALRLNKLLKKNGIDLDLKGTGFIQMINIDSIFGNVEEEVEL
ncbi:MAG: PTS sugar transporter subunit IIA [Candidatus Cloacimonetes bacterium]|nr:PTS sugar transporter subunit IIA [Candidatus Cloacimonadota bacterium]